MNPLSPPVSGHFRWFWGRPRPRQMGCAPLHFRLGMLIGFCRAPLGKRAAPKGEVDEGRRPSLLSFLLPAVAGEGIKG